MCRAALLLLAQLLLPAPAALVSREGQTVLARLGFQPAPPGAR